MNRWAVRRKRCTGQERERKTLQSRLLPQHVLIQGQECVGVAELVDIPRFADLHEFLACSEGGMNRGGGRREWCRGQEREGETL
jgi:hypothetical protein